MNDQENKQREEVALALMLKDGHQPEDIGDWRKSVYAKKADEFIEQHAEDGLCPKCQGTGFIEKEHGFFREFCDCEKGKALQAEVTGESGTAPLPVVTGMMPETKEELPEGSEDKGECIGGFMPPTGEEEVLDAQMAKPIGDLAKAEGLTAYTDGEGRLHYDSDSGTEPDNQPTIKPKRRKRKTEKGHKNA